MISARNIAPQAIGAMLKNQPLTKAKIKFAWSMAVGESIARITKVNLSSSGTLYVKADTKVWRDEINRSKPLITKRLQDLLGRDIVKNIFVKGQM